MSQTPGSIVMVLDDAGEALHVSPPAPDRAPLVWLGALVVVALAGVLLAVRLRALVRPPEEAAAIGLIRMLRLSRPERQALRRLAALSGSPPECALLLSAPALRRAVERLRREDPHCRELAPAQAMLLRLGGR